MTHVEGHVYISADEIDKMFRAGSRSFGSPTEPGAGDFEESHAVKATREALFETLKGIFGPNELRKPKQVPATLGQQTGFIRIVPIQVQTQESDESIASISSGFLSFGVIAHPDRRNPIEILSINPHRALNKNLGRMSLDELIRMSVLIEDFKAALPPKDNLAMIRRGDTQ